MITRSRSAACPSGTLEFRSPKLVRQLQRYHPRCRPAVTALATTHPRLGDLALSFPALLFALATRRGTADGRAAMTRIVGGSSLKDAAECARVPMWLRPLPPESFRHPLQAMPDGDPFRRQIANHLPVKPQFASRWLAAVADAATWAGEPMAVWLVREIGRKPGSVKSLRAVYLWVWHCSAPGTPGHALVERPWTPDISYANAHFAAMHWLDRVELWLEIGPGRIAEMWAEPGHAAGYDFVPIATMDEIEAEADAMRNCVRTYGSCISDGYARLWSVRKSGVRVATLELSIRSDDWFPSIDQLSYAGNERCPAELWWAARRWLSAQHLPYVVKRETPIDRARWLTMWKPYWLSRGSVPAWLPLAPARYALRDVGRIGPADLAGLRPRRTRRRPTPP